MESICNIVNPIWILARVFIQRQAMIMQRWQQ